ncbi:MAG: helix-turn-helix domain-containing protein, partial [Nocardioidaceae bacterium]|nr:helix-turn-helix domain-containing protein [Nocardioidaceae bacterium]
MASSSGGTQAVDRAAALVDLVVRADEPLTVTELCDESGLARST